jgi:hypothetical protein
MFDVDLYDVKPNFSLSNLVKLREGTQNEELNVLLLTKPISSEAGNSDYNNVLDALVRTFSDNQVSLFDR